MNVPSIGSYMDTIRSPHGLFRALGDVVPERDIYDEIVSVAGNKAVIFRVEAQGRPMVLKCYFKPGAPSAEVYDYVQGLSKDILSDIRLLPREMYVFRDGEGEYVDIVAGEWTEGVNLGTAIRLAVRQNDKERLEDLTRVFDSLALAILSAEWGHGDLKPENIIVTPGGGMKLIDYDAFYIPGHSPAVIEIGTEGYRHPARDEKLYDKSADHYPIALISATLRLLSCDPNLYHRRMVAESVLFSPEEVLQGRSELYQELLSAAADQGDINMFRLLRALTSPTPRIEDIANIIAPQKPAAGELQPFERNGLWGYVAPDGTEAIAPLFDSAAHFSQGLALVTFGGKHHFIATDGRVAINCARYAHVNSFSCSLAAVCVDNKWGYIDLQGNIAIEPRFDSAASMREDLAAVKVNGKYGYIDRRGAWRVEPQFDYARSVNGKKAAVEIKGNHSVIEFL